MKKHIKSLLFLKEKNPREEKNKSVLKEKIVYCVDLLKRIG
jgi:hypothetical protein